MHIETLAYLLHELPYQAKVPGTVPKAREAAEVSNSMLRVEAGLATLGQRRGEAFGWDNEFDEHQVEVDAFRVSRFKVTNREYLQYVEAGGCPSHFWVKREGQWFWRGMFGEYPLPLDGPAWVTHEQATGYAVWVGKQLPTEAQFHRYAYGVPGGKERQYPWGDQAPALGLGNFDFTFWDPIAVNATPAGDSAFGVSQAVGNGWEWTSTPFAPFEGFERFPFYPGYSADFFDGQHYVLKGGSPRTAARLLRRSFRNWFRPSYPYVYAGFRVVEPA
jgi:formylglycine-generating enzyme required for sulfatase activity